VAATKGGLVTRQKLFDLVSGFNSDAILFGAD
jgi:hypothetical protein